MPSRTLTRADLIEAIGDEVKISRVECGELLEAVLNEIAQSLERGEAVKLSSFGSFDVRSKSERMGRNPKTGKEVPITARKVLTFRASAIMKDRINQSLLTAKAAE